VKLDLWKCDRCNRREEASPVVGMPSGWVTVTLTKKHEGATYSDRPVPQQDRHLCPRCSGDFLGWIKPDSAGA
jgi:hypothetical protein